MRSGAALRAFLAATALLGALAGDARSQVPDPHRYTLFESGPVRPLALSPDGSTLFACNVPDARLEIFDVTAEGLRHAGSVPVGLEPVAVAARTNGEVWVVNHLSDSISIVDVAARRVLRTLLVGDEPRDIVFAGPGGNRAFVTAAHRGQNRPGDPELLTPGVGRSDVWVFDATDLDVPPGTTPTAKLGGKPLAILNLFGDTPRALAVAPGGGTVYAAVFHSGNKTTAVTAGVLPTPPPQFTINTTDPASEQPLAVPTPAVAVMLQHQTGNTWVDVTGATHTDLVRFQLPDYDVFELDANAATPVQTGSFSGVGTILYNMAVNPVSGAVYVSNTDANNMDRFEGFGTPNLRGELHRARVSILSAGGTVTPRHLNSHIDYASVAPPQSVNDRSLGLPTALAVSSDGATLYLAAFGSGKLAFLPTAQLAAGTYVPNTADHAELSAGGPSGVALDEANGRIYVYTRFDDGISIVNSATRAEVGHVRVHNPEPAEIVNGRPFLYDTRLSSSNGEASCAACHVFGDFDSLTWDLGDPDAPLLFNNNPFVNITGSNFGIAAGSIIPGGGSNVDFHPLKGPMNTQTLRGMEHHGPMHWRGDRSGGAFSNRNPLWDGDLAALDENEAFLRFNPAFVGLLGRQNQLSTAEMQQFGDFILALQQPPNPIRNLDNTNTASQAAGEAFYNGPISDTLKNCNGCHTLDQAQGFFGTGGLSTFEGETQHFKVAHLRNMYQKVGMFGNPALNGAPATGDPNAPQIRGFGYLHDGSVETLVRFLNAGVFNFPDGDPQRTDVANFTFAFPSDLAPVVGQQLTLTSSNDEDEDVVDRLDLLVARAGTAYADPDRLVGNNECDLIVKGIVAGEPRGWWMSAPGTFTPDVDGAPTISDANLRLVAAVPGQDLTYTCMPPGSGPRAGVDRGGVGDGSAPDGIRDASQCGDVTRDGVATPFDVAELRAWLAGGPAPAGLAKCNVAGANGSGAASCDVLDLSALRRRIVGLDPALTQGCML